MSAATWIHVAPTVLAAFLASSVEFVEALTVILAVGSVRGWRDTLAGTGAALALLLAIVAVLGSALTRVPLDAIQLVVGTLLLLFGMRWLRKAILRAAGIIPVHDEAAAYAKQIQTMRIHGIAQGWDAVAFLACQSASNIGSGAFVVQIWTMAVTQLRRAVHGVSRAWRDRTFDA